MTTHTRRGLLFRMADGLRRADIAFLASRISLVVPVFVVAHAAAGGVFAEFSRLYHAALFLSAIILYGAHEVYVVKRDHVERGWIHILLNAAVIGSIYYIISILFDVPFDFEIFAACVIFRAFVLYFITLSRVDTVGYAVALLAIGVSCALIALVGDFNLLVMLPFLPAFLFIIWRTASIRISVIADGVRSYGRSLTENFFYMSNNILSAAYIQGALFIYAFLATDVEYVVANHFVYILNMCFIFQDLVYRRGMAKFAARPLSPRRALLRMMMLALSIGALAAILLATFTPQIEVIFFGDAEMTDAHRLWLAAMLVIHASNFAWSSFLVGQGLIRLQFRFTLMTAISLILMLSMLEYGGIADPLLGAMVATSAILSVSRGLVVWRHI